MPVYRRKDTKSKRYYYKFTIDGVTYKKGIPTARTRPQALEAERQALEDVHNDIYGISSGAVAFPKFVRQTYLPWAEQHHDAYGKDRWACQILMDYFAEYTLARISPLAIEGFMQKQARVISKRGTTYKPGSLNQILATLSGILTKAKDNNLIRKNPCLKVKAIPGVEPRCRYLLPEEEEILLPATERRKFLRPLSELAITTGFRLGELLALEKPAIDFPRNRVYVVNPKWDEDPRKTKGNPMSKRTRLLLEQLCQESRTDHLFFNDRTGEHLTGETVGHLFRRICDSLGLFDLTFHSLRHTFGTRLGEGNFGIEKIQRLMGHADIKMTRIYVHPTDDGLAAAVEFASQSTRIVPGKVLEFSGAGAKSL